MRDMVKNFWARVDQSAGPDACWPWTGQQQNGYGRLNIDAPELPKGFRSITATRISLQIHIGIAPEGKEFALHHCDNPPCVNPKHLYWGDKKDNYEDMRNRGRAVNVHGEEHHFSKLTVDDVSEIHRLLARGDSKRSIGRKFGVSDTNIESILRGRSWTSVENIHEIPRPVDPERANHFLNWTEEELLLLRENAHSQISDLLPLFGRSYKSVAHRLTIIRKEMTAEGEVFKITHCQNGHEFDEANTHFRKSGKRDCRECGRVKARERRAAKRLETTE